jgi:hypothetical protein
MEDNIVFEAIIYSILQSPRPINARFWYIARLKFLKSATLSSLFGRQMCSMQCQPSLHCHFWMDEFRS